MADDSATQYLTPADRSAERRAVVREAWAVIHAHVGALVVPGLVLFVLFGIPAAVFDEVDTTRNLADVVLASAAQLTGLVASFLYYGYCEEIVRHARRDEVSVPHALAETARVLPLLIAAAFVTWICIGIGLLLLILPGLWLLTRWALVSQVIAFERTGLFRSIRRSHRLTAGNMRLVASTAVVAVLGSELLAEGAQELGHTLAHDETLGRIIGGAVGQMLVGPVAGVIVATVYFRLLARERAGLD